jgi:DNA gyrase subunit B
MMGKPLNAVKAPPRKIEAFPLFAALVEAVGAGHGAAFDISRVRYERVVLPMDADADGIHCGALMCLYFHRMMRPLLDDGRVAMAHAPMATFVSAASGVRHVYTEDEYRSGARSLREQGAEWKTTRYRGLAGLDRHTLSATCLDPDTRMLRPLGPADAQAAFEVFGGDDPAVDVSGQRRFEF